MHHCLNNDAFPVQSIKNKFFRIFELYNSKRKHMKTKQQKYLTKQHSDFQELKNEILLRAGRGRQNNSEALKEAYCYFQQCLLRKTVFLPYFHIN